MSVMSLLPFEFMTERIICRYLLAYQVICCRWQANCPVRHCGATQNKKPPGVWKTQAGGVVNHLIYKYFTEELDYILILILHQLIANN